jgi:lysyl-tRNA synthetase class II
MAGRLDRITQQRQEKLEGLRTRGVNPYPSRYQRSHTTQEAVTRLEETEEGAT